MDYTQITSAVEFTSAAVAVLLILGALAGLHVVIRGCQFLIDAIAREDDDEDDEDDVGPGPDDSEGDPDEFGTEAYYASRGDFKGHARAQRERDED